MAPINKAIIFLRQIEAPNTAQFFSVSDWVWIVIFILVLVIVWWLLSRATNWSEQESQELTTQIIEEETKTVTETPSQESDDLTRIEGIGPKIQGILNEVDIFTFSQLANADIAKLQSLLDDARLSFSDPKSWPEQAKLASEEKWGVLDELQDKLKGGRRK